MLTRAENRRIFSVAISVLLLGIGLMVYIVADVALYKRHRYDYAVGRIKPGPR